MQITSKGQYAVMALIDLAANGTDAPVTLKDISDRQGISVSYLEQLFGNLRRHDIVKSVRGPGGGYHLAVPAAKISVAQVVEAADDSRGFINSAGEDDCPNGPMCNTDSLWTSLDDVLYAYLSVVDLQQLIDLSHQGMSEAIPVTSRKHVRRGDAPQDVIGTSGAV